MEYILVSQLKLILLRLSNSDDKILTAVIISLLLLLYLSKFYIAYFFTKHYFVNYVLFFYCFCISQSISQISKVMVFTLKISTQWYC